jgi:hypothetical protein
MDNGREPHAVMLVEGHADWTFTCSVLGLDPKMAAPVFNGTPWELQDNGLTRHVITSGASKEMPIRVTNGTTRALPLRPAPEPSALKYANSSAI